MGRRQPGRTRATNSRVVDELDELIVGNLLQAEAEADTPGVNQNKAFRRLILAAIAGLGEPLRSAS